MGQDVDLSDLVAVHRDLHAEGAAEGLRFADVLVGREGFFLRHGRGDRQLRETEVRVQQFNRTARHVAAQAAAAALADDIAALDIRSRHELGDGVNAVDAGRHRLHGSSRFRLVNRQIGGAVPREQILGQLAGIRRRADQTNHRHRAAECAAQRAAGVAFLAVGEHLFRDDGIGIANLLAQGNQNRLGDAEAAAVLEIAFIGELLDVCRIQFDIGVGVRGDFLTVLRLRLQQSGNAADNRGAAQQGGALLQKFTTSLHLNTLFFVPHFLRCNTIYYTRRDGIVKTSTKSRRRICRRFFVRFDNCAFIFL